MTHTPVRTTVLVMIWILVATEAAFANGLGSAKPTVAEDKFELPTDHQVVMQEWVSRGFAPPEVKVYPLGWSRSEHAYPDSLLMTPITGRMEFIIADQRVVLEPGDELLYPRGAVMLAKNLHDGETRILISPRR